MADNKINLEGIDFGKLNAIMFDMLIDILATNNEIIQRIEAMSPPIDSSVENIDGNREVVIQYLKGKYGI